MRKHVNDKRVTERQIQEALRAFRTQGGLIRVLPEEVVPPYILVGARLGTYEPIGEYLYGAGRD